MQIMQQFKLMNDSIIRIIKHLDLVHVYTSGDDEVINISVMVV